MGEEVPEGADRLARPLIQLAHACGLSTAYFDQLGKYTEISDEALVGVLAALGVDASSDEAIAASLETEEQAKAATLMSPTIVATVGEQTVLPLNCKPEDVTTMTVTLESGEAFDGDLTLALAESGCTLTLDNSLPMGYHTLDVEANGSSTTATIINAPATIAVPKAVAQQQRWGWMTQMYSVRSADSWGVGDYGDLKVLITDAAAKSGADFMLINPIHAGAPISPIEPSPYLPESRRFLNVTYIRPQNIAEYAELSEEDRAKVDELHSTVAASNSSSDPLDLDAAWAAKKPALQTIFAQPRSKEREAQFEAFKLSAGTDLDSFAAWSVCYEVWGAPWGENRWFDEHTVSDDAVQQLISEHHDLYEFNRWLQWIAAEQVLAAQQAALEGGMTLGLMQDMAVGVHGTGVDAWANPERFAASGVTVGCPPDFYNQQGQDWGQPPFNPRYLEQTGYQVYREMVHSMYEHAGAVRIDHVLGLFRLWWIPQGLGAKNGAYVNYNYEAMLGVLSIEATRVGGMVIGEDLGTVPEYVHTVLTAHGVLGTEVAWFARVDESPNAGDPYKPPEDYRKQSLAAVVTHDMPPCAGYLQFEQVKIRRELKLVDDPDAFQHSAQIEQDAMMDRLVEGGYITREVADDVQNRVQEIVEALYRMLADTPALLLQVALVDGVGETRTQNQPGTSTEYTNWRVPLCDEHQQVVPTDTIFDMPRVRSLAAVMRGE